VSASSEQDTLSDQVRRVHWAFHASDLQRVKGYYQTKAYQQAMSTRKVWVEPLCAEAKDWHGLRCFLLRRHGPREQWGLADSGWTKSETLAQKARLETASLPSRSCFLLLFGLVWLVDSPFFGVSVFSLTDKLTFLNTYEEMHSSLLMNFVRAFFNSLRPIF
jgi:hypothetical protein